MRKLCTSSGLRRSCAEGVESSCRAHPILPTKSIIRIELEQQTYADSNLFHDPATDCPEGFRAFRGCLKMHPLYLIANCCGIVLSRSFWMVLEMVWSIPGRWRSETDTEGRTTHSNGRAGKVERLYTSDGNVHRQRRE